MCSEHFTTSERAKRLAEALMRTFHPHVAYELAQKALDEERAEAECEWAEYCGCRVHWARRARPGEEYRTAEQDAQAVPV